jgi:DNA polymerase III subunit beta
MKLICSKANLLKGVNIVSKAVPTRTTMAILECILIDAVDDSRVVSAAQKLADYIK